MADARYISDRVKKQLYALSGNECANPLCHNKLVYPDDNAKDDQICHIEAASPDGPRYNPNQTDEERRGFDNLILLCHRCHDMIDNNPDIYTVEILKKWKQEHEDIYKNSNIDKVFSFSVPDGLLSRDKEADNLFDKITNNRFFNLVGIGGSGKSSLAYLMMQKHKYDFNEIVDVVVNNNIKDDFIEQINKTLNLEFEKKEEAFPELTAYLRNNFNSEYPNLLVLDINETSDKTQNDEIINTIIKNKDILNGWKILILSRENVDTRNRIETRNLNDNADVEFLKELFLSKAGTRYNDFGNFAELFKVIFYNPLLAEQLGLYLNDEPELATIEDIKKILYGESFIEEDMQGLSAERHDEKIVTFLINLIKYNDLNDNEKNLLRHFVLWQADYIGYEVIKDLLNGVFESDDDLKNALKSLSKRSILDTNNDKTLGYKLHGLLAASLRKQMDIDNEDYDMYLSNIKRIIEYKPKKLIPFTDCIGHSLCKYYITIDFTIIHNVALKFVDVWKTDYSEKLYNKAIEIILYWVLIDKDNPEFQYKLAWTFNNLAIMQMDILEKYESAAFYFERAIEVGELLPTDHPEYQNELARAYNNLAIVQMNHFGDYKLAECNYQKTIAIRTQMPKDNMEGQFGLALVYNNLAILQSEHLGEYKSAMFNYQNGIDIGKQIPTDNPKYQNLLTMMYFNLANLQCNYLEDCELAEKNYKNAIIIGKHLPKNNTQFQNTLANAYYNIANFYCRQQKFLDAKIYIEYATVIFKHLSEYNPCYFEDLLKSTLTYAKVLLENNEKEKSKTAIVELVKYAKQLTDNNDNKWKNYINNKINQFSEKINQRQ